MRRAQITRTAKAAVLVPALLALVASVIAVPGVRATPRVGAATMVESPLADDSQDCLEAVPAAVSSRGLTDNGNTISLDVLVLLDRLSRTRGTEVMTKAAQAYAPLGIKVKSTFRRANLRSDGNVPRVFDEMIRVLGGARPKGTDLVYLMTDKDLYVVENGELNYDVAGVAYCIGGVRFPNAAFAIGEGKSPWEYRINDYTFSAKIAAHEIGHVMGAHHHYGNCVEGDGSTDGGGEPSVCTVMWPAYVAFMAANFGTLESTVIRGHAVRFASP